MDSIRRGIRLRGLARSEGWVNERLMVDRYFCNPDADAIIEALPGTFEKEEDKKWPAIRSDDYLVQRLSQTYGY